MFMSFVSGAVAGVGLVKYYEAKQDEDEKKDDNDNGTRTNTTSDATLMNSTSGYNESADTTSGATHVNFLSDIVARLWPYINKAGTQMVRDIVEPKFKELLPGPLATLKFIKLELGTVPLVLDNILVRELRKVQDNDSGEEYLQFEWDVIWNSKCDIQLATDKLGGIAPISFGVKGVTLSGRLQVIAKPLSSALPCIDAIQFAFVNPPTVELDFTGLANVADMKFNIGGINLVDVKGIVRDIVNDILASSLVLPNRTHAPLAANVDYRDIFCPAYKGLARVHLHSGRGFEIEKSNLKFLGGKDDIPDVYCKIRLGVEDFWKSSCIQDNCNPKWNADTECHDFLYCCGRDQILEIQAWDSDSGTLDADDQLGIAFVSIGQVMLHSKGKQGTMELQLLKPATSSGKNATPTEQYITISLEKLPFTTTDLSSFEQVTTTRQKNDNDCGKKGKKVEHETSPEGKRVVGLETIIISHVTDLPFDNAQVANTFIKVWAGSVGSASRKELGRTPLVVANLNPQYQVPFSRPIRAADMVHQQYCDQESRNTCFELCQVENPDDDLDKKALSLGEIVITPEEIRQEHSKGDHSSSNSILRDTRSFIMGRNTDHENYKTQLAFSVSLAGVAQSTLSKRNNAQSTSKITTNTSIETSIGEGGISSSNSSDGVIVSAVEQQQQSESPTNDTAVLENRIRVRIVKGYGFQTDAKQLFRKADIPDVYCTIKFGSSPAVWRTPTIKDNENPTWDHTVTHDYIMESMNQVLSIDVWDENKRSDDQLYGNARTSIGKILLNGGTLDVEVEHEKSEKKKTSNFNIKKSYIRSNQSNMFITVECSKL
mmetsp:Transcript_7548/g.8717  ORF Transcript_7548/g.8717 Transcript_7548/m.8717 type:complete len:828 (-) Transcript_7548:183-2666(-)